MSKFKIPLLLLIAVALLAFAYSKSSQKPPESSEHMHKSAEVDKDCPGKFIARQIIIRDGQFFPNRLEVEKCTIVEFMNFDKTDRLPAFGEHDVHTHYSTFEEEVLAPGQHNGFVTKELGTFNFHDHYDEGMQGTLIVTEN